MQITIDKAAGFCPGVQKAIGMAEKELLGAEVFYCLGSLLHNEKEMERLRDEGLRDVGDLGDLGEIEDRRVKKCLVRAHGEPPKTYEKAKEMGIELIDATCGVVKRLQENVKRAAVEMQSKNGQLVIFGKKGHPEAIGLLGNTLGLGILISSMQELSKVDMTRPVRLFSQTTMDGRSFGLIAEAIEKQMEAKNPAADFVVNNTICRYVSNRIPALKEFAALSEVIIFVSGRESSNGNKLFKICKAINIHTHFISGVDELQAEWFKGFETVGISGAASTPQWLMEDVEKQIKKMN